MRDWTEELVARMTEFYDKDVELLKTLPKAQIFCRDKSIHLTRLMYNAGLPNCFQTQSKARTLCRPRCAQTSDTVRCGVFANILSCRGLHLEMRATAAKGAGRCSPVVLSRKAIF